MKNINKFTCMVAVFICILVLSGCGKSAVLQDDMSGYVNGMKLVDLRDIVSIFSISVPNILYIHESNISIYLL